jgi:integrase
MRAEAGVKDFRFHDYRHDFGTKLLRETGNLKLVQKALNHRDIKSTLRYAHVLDADVASAVEAVAKSRKSPGLPLERQANALIVFLDCISGDKLSGS